MAIFKLFSSPSLVDIVVQPSIYPRLPGLCPSPAIYIQTGTAHLSTYTGCYLTLRLTVPYVMLRYYVITQLRTADLPTSRTYLIYNVTTYSDYLNPGTSQGSLVI